MANRNKQIAELSAIIATALIDRPGLITQIYDIVKPDTVSTPKRLKDSEKMTMKERRARARQMFAQKAAREERKKRDS